MLLPTILWLATFLVHHAHSHDLIDYCKTSYSLDDGLFDPAQRMKAGRCSQAFTTQISESTAYKFCRAKLPIMDVTAKWTQTQVTCTWEHTHSCPKGGYLIEGTCFMVITGASGMTYEESKKACTDATLYLATVSDNWKVILISDVIETLVKDSIWVQNLLNDEDSKAVQQEIPDPHNPTQNYIKIGVDEYAIGQSKQLALFVKTDHALNILQKGRLIPTDPTAKFPALCSYLPKNLPPPPCPPGDKCPPPVNPVGPILDKSGKLFSYNMYSALPNQTTVNFATTRHFHDICKQLSNGVEFSLVVNKSDILLHVPVEFDETSMAKVPPVGSCTPNDTGRLLLSESYMVIVPNGEKKHLNEKLWSSQAPAKPNSMCADMHRVVAEGFNGLVNVPSFVRHRIACGNWDDTNVVSDGIVCPCADERKRCISYTKCECKDLYHDAATIPELANSAYQVGEKCVVQDCKDETVAYEVTFIIDESGSIGQDGWDNMTNFLLNMHTKLSSRAATVHFVKFGSIATYCGELQRNWTPHSWSDHLKNNDVLHWNGGATATSHGLKVALEHAGKGKRRIFVMITDGNPTAYISDDQVHIYGEDPPYAKSIADAKDLANQVKNAGIKLVSVGVKPDKGYVLDMALLHEISNEAYQITGGYAGIDEGFDKIFKIICNYV